MTVTDVVDAYLTRQRSLGMRFEGAGRMLHRFSRVTGNPDIDEVTPEAVAKFLHVDGNLSTTWMLKYRVLTGLYKFAVGRGYVCDAPLPKAFPKLPPQQTPYVYSTEELCRLLEATSVLQVGHSPRVPTIYRTLLVLLYGSGMRIGEALGLAMQDVDLSAQVITVRDTKFFKTRLVPIGPKLTRELAAHMERRRLLPLPAGEASPLFTTRDGRPWELWSCYIMVSACSSRRRNQLPRRRTSASTAARHSPHSGGRIGCRIGHRSGQDVQRLLPQLATYLGHLDIRSTQRYLQMTPDLLLAASQRFAQYRNGGRS